MQVLRRRVFHVLSAAALAAVPALAVNAEAEFERTLDVSGPAELDLSTGAGSIRVLRGSSGAVVVHGLVRAGNGGWGNWLSRSGDDPEARVREVADNPPIQQDGNRITIGARSRRPKNVSISYEIEVPEGSNLQLNSGSGSIECKGVGGTLRAESGSGSLQITDVTGKMLAVTGSGSIRVARVRGEVDIDTGSGGIDVDDITGSLRVDTGSGGINVAGEMRGDWLLDTGSGGISVDLPADAAFSLDAETGSGSIRTEHPVTIRGEISKRKLQTDVRGGGHALRMHSGSGGLRIN